MFVLFAYLIESNTCFTLSYRCYMSGIHSRVYLVSSIHRPSVWWCAVQVDIPQCNVESNISVNILNNKPNSTSTQTAVAEFTI